MRSENNGSFDIFQYIYICGERIYAVGVNNHGLCTAPNKLRDKLFRMQIQPHSAAYEHRRGLLRLLKESRNSAGGKCSRLVRRQRHQQCFGELRGYRVICGIGESGRNKTRSAAQCGRGGKHRGALHIAASADAQSASEGALVRHKTAAREQLFRLRRGEHGEGIALNAVNNIVVYAYCDGYYFTAEHARGLQQMDGLHAGHGYRDIRSYGASRHIARIALESARDID